MDYPSDSDESDVDFVPEGELSASDAESEAEADAETEAQYENEKEKKLLKRKATTSKKSNKRTRGSKAVEEEVKPSPKKELNTVEEKKHEDDLWASFLSDTSAPKVEEVPDVEKVEKEKPVKSKTLEVPEKSLDDLVKNRVSSSPLANSLGRPKPAAGLSSILGQLGQKSKLTTLEKSKQDWMSFKKDEGIEEELSLYNKGKSGYLERQDFLQRTDLRQFEIEKNLRTTKRTSNR